MKAETRAKISAALRGKPSKMKGRPKSPAHKAKISAAHRAIPAERRAALAAALSDVKTLHGHAGSRLDTVKLPTPTYISWAMIIQRCYDPRASGYSIHGGRGVKVCNRWRDFRNFLADMGERPPGTTIGRIDRDGDFEPGNCRWIPSTRVRAEKYPERVRRKKVK